MITNEHLNIVFEEILPVLENTGLVYWVSGGVAIAGIQGQFVRENEDVDVYVWAEDFEKTEKEIRKLCELHGSWDGDVWSYQYSMLKSTRRPKIDLLIRGKEVFSVTPMYKMSEGIEFRTPNRLMVSTANYVGDTVSVGSHTFVIPPKKVVGIVFLEYMEILKNQGGFNDQGLSQKYKIDAKVLYSHGLISDNQYRSFFPLD
jgi:hypothetical protein